MTKKGADPNASSWERMNTHDTTSVDVEVMGHMFQLVQNPSSEHLGTTVWDASIVLAKMVERNMRKGEFSRAKLSGKRVIELGSGMGLGGMAFAMLDADVTLTDTVEVLPLLKRNCEANMGCGKVTVRELDWMQPQQVAGLSPPFDYIIAADCIYHETIVEHFHRTVMDLSDHKTTVLVVNELRSHSVQSRFMELFSASHIMKQIPHSKQDPVYQHPNILFFQMKKKKKGAAAAQDDAEEADDAAAAPTVAEPQQQPDASVSPAGSAEQQPQQEQGPAAAAATGGQEEAAGVPAASEAAGGSGIGSDGWSARRLGVEMARLMKDVKAPEPDGAGQ